jgi:hypothetical protein
MRALERGPSKEKESDEQNPEMRGTTYVTPLFLLAATSLDENCERDVRKKPLLVPSNKQPTSSVIF